VGRDCIPLADLQYLQSASVRWNKGALGGEMKSRH